MKAALDALIALAFAVVIWAAVGARIMEEQAYRVPLEIEVREPAGVAVEFLEPRLRDRSQRPLVEAWLRGPHELMAKLVPSELSCRLVVAKVDDDALEKGTELVLEIPSGAFRIPASGIEVVRVDTQVRVVYSREERRQLRVVESVAGAPAPGFRLGRVVIEPNVIEVSGPGTRLRSESGPLKTEAISLSGVRETFTTRRNVRVPVGLVAPQDRVNVRVEIEPELVEDDFVLPLRILTRPDLFEQRCRIAQKEWTVTVRLRGPPDRLKALKAAIPPPGSARPFSEGQELPLAFIRLMGDVLQPGKDNQSVEVLNLPPDVTYLQTKKFEVTIEKAP